MIAGSHHLAIYNFGVHTGSYLTASVQGFALREPLNFEAAARAVGFLGRSGYEGEPGPESWSELVFPRFLMETGRASGVSSLSLWRDIESLMAFTYAGVHADALKHARHWNERQAWPPLVLFWIEAGVFPSWAEAVRRFELLADRGPTAEAFSFKTTFAADGSMIEIDRQRVKDLSAKNVEGQAELLSLVRTLPV
ncbi:hypothetical protein J2045_001522 [Peteryoungia aggregata LMG 23059]|uniref:DUF3291 domain-containing protein n=1 Tax=Peteryoungia aggregata LMG 23059 TaxID=1368425 RepID=A0ABU0G579_9HYPH|nr:DUF3291 domain-containing protein [Peteryoungia aggregata]MDQ0420498.1 hypothetical protein [Peteryoungia aggregata LMG 23059]